tara:strand:- start:2375 stop:3094 length:720 start_codon:yes stop_codon:yes gene_type:complete
MKMEKEQLEKLIEENPKRDAIRQWIDVTERHFDYLLDSTLVSFVNPLDIAWNLLFTDLITYAEVVGVKKIEYAQRLLNYHHIKDYGDCERKGIKSPRDFDFRGFLTNDFNIYERKKSFFNDLEELPDFDVESTLSWTIYLEYFNKKLGETLEQYDSEWHTRPTQFEGIIRVPLEMYFSKKLQSEMKLDDMQNDISERIKIDLEDTLKYPFSNNIKEWTTHSVRTAMAKMNFYKLMDNKI